MRVALATRAVELAQSVPALGTSHCQCLCPGQLAAHMDGVLTFMRVATRCSYRGDSDSGRLAVPESTKDVACRGRFCRPRRPCAFTLGLRPSHHLPGALRRAAARIQHREDSG
ncbi:hypothetical protein GY45DRAFT_1320315 [Cubamyces sp. BRFM 1775]|nr:hypothetical protein GY45DRAFT_1320315 [Cubamyces sp. BRFM 1775]